MVNEFLAREQSDIGWRFWLLWVLATNVGFFPGLALGNQLSASVAEPVSSAVVGGMFAAMVGVAQWAVLRRHLPSTHHWITATTIGWVLGAIPTGATTLGRAWRR